MGKKREEPKPFHKRGLQDDIEDPEAYGVRVSGPFFMHFTFARRIYWLHGHETIHVLLYIVPGIQQTKPRAEKKRRRLTEEGETDDAIDDKISARILRVARDQQNELEDEQRTEGPLGSLTGALKGRSAAGAGPSGRDADGNASKKNKFGLGQDEYQDDSDLGSDLEGFGSDEEYEIEEEEINEDDEKALRAFMVRLCFLEKFVEFRLKLYPRRRLNFCLLSVLALYKHRRGMERVRGRRHWLI